MALLAMEILVMQEADFLEEPWHTFCLGLIFDDN